MSQTPPSVQELQRDADTDGNLVTFLDAALWEQLSRSSGLEELALAWLTLLCCAIDGAQQGLLLLEAKEANVFEPMAAWPEGAGKVPALVRIATTALKERRGVVREAGAIAGSGI